MAEFTDVNNAVASGGEALYLLRECLDDAGWSVIGSGDGGVNYRATDGTAITHGGAGAFGMNNANAWYRITDAGNRREYTVQRGNLEYNARIKYSALTKFDEAPTGGGAVGAAITPSATDEYQLLGSVTDTAPTYAALFTAGGTYQLHVVAQSTVEGGVYPFWMWATVNGTGVTSGVFMCEPMTVGSYPSADADPCLNYVGSGGLTYTAIQGTSAFKGWYKMDLADELFVGIPGLTLQSNSGMVYPGAVGTNPYDNDDNGLQITFGRGSPHTTQGGHKGVSKR